ncbi:unnamed protein product [Miscanthus lutarioriparius]|uniref:Uncharacterized protein n=1 Tax=Miscanthus lutarioriparius TaxID=422564 RepID=A0A811QDK2_9POAL|nr:unnamed protein product [Miscanthus lutarioriparius]
MLRDAYDDDLASYMSHFRDYQTWLDEDARARVVFVASMDERLATDIVQFDHAFSNPCFLSAMSPMLSLTTCDSYRKQQSHLELQSHLWLLTRLRAEFEPLRAQLLAREPCVSLMEALATVHNEETSLRFAGLLQSTSSSVLAARFACPGVLGSAPKGSSSVVSSSGTRSSGGLHCDHCDRDGHVEAHCYKKKRQAQSRQGGRPSQGPGTATTGVSQSTGSSQHTDTQEIVMLLRRLAASVFY